MTYIHFQLDIFDEHQLQEIWKGPYLYKITSDTTIYCNFISWTYSKLDMK